MSTKSNVSTAKPKTGGALYVAPAGTTVPTDATTALDAAFKSLGYMSEDGLVNSTNKTREDIKAWGGDIVDSPQTEYKDTFKGKLIEALNIDVLKTVYGSNNVSGALATGITVKANGGETDELVFVAEMVMRNGALKRVVIPCGKVTEMSDINYKAGDPISYEITITAYALDDDPDGNTHYEYIIRS